LPGKTSIGAPRPQRGYVIGIVPAPDACHLFGADGAAVRG
jgi:hypothetical protein